METLKNLPLELVNLILAYDNRFIIRNGMVSQRLDNKKYAEIREKLLSKPKQAKTYNAETKHFWAWVAFDMYMIKYYNIEDDINDIRYEFRRKVGPWMGPRYLVRDKMAIK
jgi:hypothetical protein